MPKIAKSPERNTFQKDGYVKRCKEEGKEPNPDYVAMYESQKQQDEANVVDPEWQKDNMEYNLRVATWICDKVKASDSYAQNLYAAMCNRDFMKNDVMPILKDQRWSASWRHAGGIVADMREEGDYIDWYCSGIGGFSGGGSESSPEIEAAILARIHYVPEGTVTDEIREDLFRLGWIALEDDDDNQ
jgi:hypothetical protein